MEFINVVNLSINLSVQIAVINIFLLYIILYNMKLIQGSSLNTMRLSCIDNRPFIFDIFLIDNKLHIIGP